MAFTLNGGETGSWQNNGTAVYTGSTGPWNSNDVNPYLNSGGNNNTQNPWNTAGTTTPQAQIGTNPYSSNAWQQGVQITSPDNQGGVISQAANPFQFATQATGQDLASKLGLRSYGENIASPGGAYSQDMQMLNRTGTPGREGMNAGLAAVTANNFGLGPGTYGQFLLDRDKGWLEGKQIADPYAQKNVMTEQERQAANARDLAAQGLSVPAATSGGFGGYGPAYQAPQTSSPYTVSQGQQPQQQIQGDFFAQLMTILSALLGQQQPARQRPPVLPQRANTGNYFSRFA